MKTIYSSPPAKADLVLEIKLVALSGPSSGNKVNSASDPLPMLRLTVYDRPTHYILWAFGATIDAAALQKSHDRNFDDSIVYLVDNHKNPRHPIVPHLGPAMRTDPHTL